MCIASMVYRVITMLGVLLAILYLMISMRKWFIFYEIRDSVGMRLIFYVWLMREGGSDTTHRSLLGWNPAPPGFFSIGSSRIEGAVIECPTGDHVLYVDVYRSRGLDLPVH